MPVKQQLQEDLRSALRASSGTWWFCSRRRCSVTIRAPPERVWSWLVQIGQGRGGFYSYRWVENFFGLRIHDIEQVDPEMQTLHEGDLIRAAPDGWLGTRDLGWKVWRVEDGTLLQSLESGSGSSPILTFSPDGIEIVVCQVNKGIFSSLQDRHETFLVSGVFPCSCQCHYILPPFPKKMVHSTVMQP